MNPERRQAIQVALRLARYGLADLAERESAQLHREAEVVEAAIVEFERTRSPSEAEVDAGERALCEWLDEQADGYNREAVRAVLDAAHQVVRCEGCGDYRDPERPCVTCVGVAA